MGVLLLLLLPPPTKLGLCGGEMEVGGEEVGCDPTVSEGEGGGEAEEAPTSDPDPLLLTDPPTCEDVPVR